MPLGVGEGASSVGGRGLGVRSPTRRPVLVGAVSGPVGRPRGGRRRRGPPERAGSPRSSQACAARRRPRPGPPPAGRPPPGRPPPPAPPARPPAAPSVPSGPPRRGDTGGVGAAPPVSPRRGHLTSPGGVIHGGGGRSAGCNTWRLLLHSGCSAVRRRP